jgi:hypothetical protein
LLYGWIVPVIIGTAAGLAVSMAFSLVMGFFGVY